MSIPHRVSYYPGLHEESSCGLQGEEMLEARSPGIIVTVSGGEENAQV